MGATVPTADDITERFDDADPTNEAVRRRIEALLPEARLMAAVLRDALRRARTLSTAGPTARAKEREWLCATGVTIFSAAHCCQVLGIEHDALCSTLRRRWQTDDAALAAAGERRA